MPKAHVFPAIPTKILLPIDFSPSSQAALEKAADLAKHFHAKLYLVNVIALFPPSTLPDVIPEATSIQESRAFAERHPAKCKAAFVTKRVNSTSSVEVGNDIVGEITEVIDREHIDMVIISTHGISGWHPLVFGSIAENVVKLVQCPLLLLRSVKPGVKTASRRATTWWKQRQENTSPILNAVNVFFSRHQRSDASLYTGRNGHHPCRSKLMAGSALVCMETMSTVNGRQQEIDHK